MKRHLFPALCRPGRPASRPAAFEHRSAFTIVELLTVVSIIAILMGMAGTASYAAKQSSYRSQAQAEVREIANACRAFWVASGSWKGGARWPGPSGNINRGEVYKSLTGDNPSQAVFLAFDEQRMDSEDGYLDPWGHPYKVYFEKKNDVSTRHKFSATVSFPMRNRHDHYGWQFEP